MTESPFFASFTVILQSPSSLFANAFVRANGMPFQVVIQEPAKTLTRDKMLADAEALLDEFSDDYKRMAE